MNTFRNAIRLIKPSRAFRFRFCSSLSSLGKGTFHNNVMFKLLESLGSQKEVDQYVKMYSQVDSLKFAVIKVGGGVLLDELDQLCDSLAFLQQVGLYPIVVHGAGPQLNKTLTALGIQSDYIGGMRITSREIIKTAHKVFQQENLKLVEALEKRGTRARPIISGVFGATLKDQSLGYVGEINSVNTAQIDSSIRDGYLPILTCMGADEFGQSLNINADVAARELSKALQPVKVVYISQNGGLLDQDKNLITNIDILDDFDKLMAQPWLKHGDRLKLTQIKDILDVLPSSSSVAVTSAKLLAQELFTHRGSGTLIRNYEKIHSFDSTSFHQLDQDRLKELIETSFGGTLTSDYFTQILPSLEKIYISGLYRAAAIVVRPKGFPDKIAYLEKFAVLEQFRSHGLGNRIWKRMIADFPDLVWRSRPCNQINPWYFYKSNGSIRMGDWSVFWTGSSSVSEIEPTLQLVAETPKTLNKAGDISIPLYPSANKLRVGLLGARGYTGEEIVKILDKHPDMELVTASSRKHVGKPVNSVFSNIKSNVVFSSLGPDDLEEFGSTVVDQWIFALPNGHAHKYASFVGQDVGIIDLSADYRFDDDWSYGLPESKQFRSKLVGSKRISNPGCYATGAQLGLLPLSEGLLDTNFPPSVFGVSGYSGAGTTPSNKNDPVNLKDNMIPYSLIGHIHENEISRHCTEVRFSPHVGHWFRGISLTISGDLSSPCSSNELMQWFNRYYEDSPESVQIVEGVPSVRGVDGKIFAQIGGFQVSSDGKRFALVVTIDNLLKGAASQCIQNLNLSYGFAEFKGLL